MSAGRRGVSVIFSVVSDGVVRQRESFCLKDEMYSASTYIYELAENHNGNDGNDRYAGS